jgi:DivIVA domain-containing protein
MPRRIVIDVPDDAPERLYAELTTALSSVAQAVGNAASPPVRVAVHHDLHGQEPVGHRPGTRPPGGFTVALRGYDRAQVDDWVSRVQRTTPPYPQPSFTVVLRGYNRAEVDHWVRQVVAR